MKQYIVTGMTCAACQARVEKAVSKLPGVESCSVSLLTNSMGVTGTAGDKEIIDAVVKAGYGASLKGATGKEQTGSISVEEDALKDRETPLLKKRLLWSLGFLLLLMYLSMGKSMLGLPAPAIFDNLVVLATTEMLLAILVMYINRKFFTVGFRTLFALSPNMDTLVALGSGASFLYSLVELYIMMLAQGNGDSATVMKYGMNLYFETAAMIPTLITVGKLLEAISKGKTTDALKGLMKLAPKTAVLYRDGEERSVPIEEVQVGDIFVVRPGENIPVDGIITEGNTAVNEAALTGESIPVDKAPGEQISAATLNQSGYIRARATRVGEDTTLAQIIHMVSDAAATKAPIARVADRVSAVFVPAVIGIALVTMLIWLLTGHPFSAAIARAVAILVISCPCALGLATPVAIMVGNGMGAKNGILFKTAVSQELAGRISVVAVDKTGTITNGSPVLTDVLPAEGVSREELLSTAVSLEAKSEHPLAKAITAYGREQSVLPYEVEDFKALAGSGLRAWRAGKELLAGNGRFIGEKLSLPEDIRREAERLSGEGKTPLFFAEDGRLLGVIAVADTMKADSARAIRELRGQGIEVVMLTGDNERTAEAIGREAGVDRVIAGVLPDGKEAVIRELQSRGARVAMVGDGINDAPALTRADLGIAIGAGADVAVDAADIVLMKSRLTDVSAAIRLSRATIRNIHQNLFWAFFYNAICIPLAAGFYSYIFGWDWEMNPMIGAAAMALSSFTVCMNALRLNLLDVYDQSKDKAIRVRAAKRNEDNTNIAEIGEEKEKTMTKELKIEGMMCAHCEARVKKALEAVAGVSEAAVSHEKGNAVVTLTESVDNEVLKAAVEAEDYKVIEVA